MGLQSHPVGLALAIFGLLSWVIALGGSGAATYQCNTAKGSVQCAKRYQLEWWALWFEFSLLVSYFITMFTRAYHRGRPVFMSYFTMCTTLLMISSHNFINDVDITALGLKNYATDATNAAAAGFVLMSITNFCLLIVIGLDTDKQVSSFYPSSAPGGASSEQFHSSPPV